MCIPHISVTFTSFLSWLLFLPLILCISEFWIITVGYSLCLFLRNSLPSPIPFQNPKVNFRIPFLVRPVTQPPYASSHQLWRVEQCSITSHHLWKMPKIFSLFIYFFSLLIPLVQTSFSSFNSVAPSSLYTPTYAVLNIVFFLLCCFWVEGRMVIYLHSLNFYYICIIRKQWHFGIIC